MSDITINLNSLRETIQFGMHPTHDELRFLWQLATGIPLPRKQRCPLCNAEGRIKQQVNATLNITNNLVKEKVTTHKLEETSKPCPQCNGTGYEQLPEDNFLIEFTPNTPADQLVPLTTIRALTISESEVWFRSYLPSRPHNWRYKTWAEYVAKAEQTWNSLRSVRQSHTSWKEQVSDAQARQMWRYPGVTDNNPIAFTEDYYRLFPEDPSRPNPNVPTTNPPPTSPDPSPQPTSQRQEPQQPSPSEVPTQPPPPETSRLDTDITDQPLGQVGHSIPYVSLDQLTHQPTLQRKAEKIVAWDSHPDDNGLIAAQEVAQAYLDLVKAVLQ